MSGPTVDGADCALDDMAARVEAGLRFDLGVARRAIRSTLEAAGLPSGAVLLRRTTLFTEVPDEPVFEPVELHGAARGESAPWLIATRALSVSIVDSLELLLDAIANAAQAELPDEVLMDVVV